jgi:uncharacterized phage protein (TIGR02216 family)
MTRAAPFPWAEAMAFGFGVLRLGPREFWAMTPRELGAAYEGLTGQRTGRPLPRERLDQLMRAYPDQETRHGG